MTLLLLVSIRSLHVGSLHVIVVYLGTSAQVRLGVGEQVVGTEVDEVVATHGLVLPGHVRDLLVGPGVPVPAHELVQHLRQLFSSHADWTAR